MKPLSLFRAVSIVCLLAAAAAAQTAGWVRVQSDDGDFSVEVPAEHKFFFEKSGFVVSRDSRDFQVRNMAMLISYTEGALLSFEVYDADRGALDAMYESDEKGNNWTKGPKIKIGDATARQLVYTAEKENYAVARYFWFGRKAVVMIAGSRKGSTPEIRRFLDSVVLNGNSNAPADRGVKFSQLKVSDVTLEVNENPVQAQPLDAANSKLPDDNVIKVWLFRKPKASYVDEARNNNVSGTVRLRATLDADGWIPRIEINKQLPGGLVRQSLFALIRTRFLPEEKDGVPIRKTVTIDYGFAIY